MKNKMIISFIKKIQSFILNKFNHIKIQELRRYAKIASVVFCIAIFVMAISLTVKSPSVNNVIAQATTVKLETFTELYFENHTKLPIELKSNNQFTKGKAFKTNLYSFSFTIHNLENKDMNYPFEVYKINNDTQLIDQGTIFIKNNESKTITENFVLPFVHPKNKVVVNLTNKNQQIFFWMGEQK